MWDLEFIKLIFVYEWEPSTEDVLRASAINHHTFDIIGVGGQRNESIHTFDNVGAILFVEDEKKNAMRESKLIKIGRMWGKCTGMHKIMLLNNYLIFEFFLADRIL